MLEIKTRPSLLEGIKRGDEVSWSEFIRDYKPLIQSIGRKIYPDNSEQDDLVQIVVSKVFKDQKNFIYDRSKGPLEDI